MPRQRRTERDLCCFLVAHFADGKNFRIEAQNMAEHLRKRLPCFFTDRNLQDTGQEVLHGIIQRQNACLLTVQLRESGIERRRLPRSHRADPGRDPRRTLQQGADSCLVIFRESKCSQLPDMTVARQEAKDNCLPIYRRHRRSTHIDISALP